MRSKNDSFRPTKEQERIISAFNEAVREAGKKTIDERGGLSAIIPVEAPAGTGKTQTTLYCMKNIQENYPEKKIAYFIFNNFMKEEIKWRASIWEIENSDYYTFHSFFLHQALQNESLSRYFIDSSGNSKIDFAKQNYSRSDYSKAVESTLGFSTRETAELFRLAISDFLTNTKKMISSYNDFMNHLFQPSDKKEQGSLQHKKAISLMRKSGESIMSCIEEGIRSEIEKRSKGVVPTKTQISTLFLSEATKNLFKNSMLTHSAYYKMVYLYAKREKLDLLKDYDAIIIDEAQDIDPIFLRIIADSKVPKMLIGDRHQGIYSFRGSINMMEEVERERESYAMTYSFRYKNDIALFSNHILQKKKSPPSYKIVGKHTIDIKSIRSNPVNEEEIAKIIMKKIDKSVGEATQFFDEELKKAPKRKLSSFLAKRKIGVIARNNATLITSILEAWGKVKESGNGTFATFSLTSAVSDELKKVKKGTFDSYTEKKISEAIGEEYSKWKKNKTLQDIVQNWEVRGVLANSAKYSFLVEEGMLNKYMALMDSLSSRKKDSIQADDKNANVVFTTAHGSKGKEYDEVIVAHDFMKSRSDEDEIPEEEINLAYVAVTRAKHKLFFAVPKGKDPLDNKIYELFEEAKDEIEQELSKTYRYTFAGGIAIDIQPTSIGMLEYKTTQNGKEVSLFLDQDLIDNIAAGIVEPERGEVNLVCFRGGVRDDSEGGKERKVIYFSPDGKRLSSEETKQVIKRCKFVFGAGAMPSSANSNEERKARIKNDEGSEVPRPSREEKTTEAPVPPVPKLLL